MTITHHPADETLVALAAGALDAGRQYVVEAHTGACVRCRRAIALLVEAGGLLLDGVEPVSMGAAALQSALAQLDAPAKTVAGARDAAFALPPVSEMLAAPDRGPWTWVGPGVHMRPLYTPKAGETRVFLLKAAPGLGLPEHTHSGSELTVVLSGAFAHAGGRFAVGDCDDADDTDEHNPVVESGEACICLVAMDGQLKLQGLLGRMMQPFVRL